MLQGVKGKRIRPYHGGSISNICTLACLSISLMVKYFLIITDRNFVLNFTNASFSTLISLYVGFFFVVFFTILLGCKIFCSLFFSYYPLFPPSEDVCIDYEEFAEHARLPCKPDVFIIPSDLRYFVKVRCDDFLTAYFTDLIVHWT